MSLRFGLIEIVNRLNENKSAPQRWVLFEIYISLLVEKGDKLVVNHEMSLNHSPDSTPTLLVELSLLQSHACLSWIHSEHVLFLLHTNDILSLIVNPFSSLALQIPLLGYLHGFEKFGPVFYNVTAMVSKPVFFDLDPVDFKLKMLLTLRYLRYIVVNGHRLSVLLSILVVLLCCK